MGILAKIGAWFANVLLGVLLEKINAYIKQRKEAKETAQRLKDEILPKVEALKNAKTKGEIDAAADDLLSKF